MSKSVNGQYYLAVNSIKTGSPSLVKLPAYAIRIIEKYSKKGSRLLPRFNASNLNKFIKVLLEKASFTHPVHISRNRRGIAVEIKNQHHSTAFL
jgi:hypothetical protein